MVAVLIGGLLLVFCSGTLWTVDGRSFVIGRCEVLSAVVVEVAGFWTVFLNGIALAFHFWTWKIGLNCWTLLFGLLRFLIWSLNIRLFWGLFIMILFLSCSRSFMNRRSRLFFCLTCSISERRFAMVFAFVPAVPCVHWLCPLWFEKYYWLNHGHSLLLWIFLDILHILHWSANL